MIKLTTIWTENERKAKERLEICKFCDEEDDGLCKKCGCLLSLKARFPYSDCPLGKWDEDLDRFSEN